MKKKKSKCPKKKKFSKCEEGEKMFKCRISGVRKKKELKEKFRKIKKIKIFWWWNFLLSSCSLVGLCVNLQVKVTGKKRKFSKCFSVECLKLRLRFARISKVG